MGRQDRYSTTGANVEEPRREASFDALEHRGTKRCEDKINEVFARGRTRGTQLRRASCQGMQCGSKPVDCISLDFRRTERGRICRDICEQQQNRRTRMVYCFYLGSVDDSAKARENAAKIHRRVKARDAELLGLV